MTTRDEYLTQVHDAGRLIQQEAEVLVRLLEQYAKTNQLSEAGLQGISQFAEQLSPDRVGSVFDLALSLHMFPQQHPATQDDVQIAGAVVRRYLEASRPIEQVKLGELGIKRNTDVEKAYRDYVAARRAAWKLVDPANIETTDPLEELVAESGVIAQQRPVDTAQFISHLRAARDLIRQQKAENLDAADEAYSQLIENWQAAIEHLPEPTGSVPNRAAIADTFDIHELIETVYNILAEDVIAAEPLNPAIL